MDGDDNSIGRGNHHGCTAGNIQSIICSPNDAFSSCGIACTNPSYATSSTSFGLNVNDLPMEVMSNDNNNGSNAADVAKFRKLYHGSRQDHQQHRRRTSRAVQQQRSSSSSCKTEAQADAMLAQELNEMSAKEREDLMHDVHGVLPAADEPPEFVASKLKEMEHEVTKICRKKRCPAFDRALFLSPSRVRHDDAFRMMFLRADQWDPARAAQRLILHYEYKLELFGPDKLVKTITLDDFDQDDMDCMKTGAVQFSKTKDRSGRTVVFVTQSAYNCKSWRNKVCPLSFWIKRERTRQTSTSQNGSFVLL